MGEAERMVTEEAMSEWHEAKPEDIELDRTKREVNIFVKQNDSGSVYVTVPFAQITELAGKIDKVHRGDDKSLPIPDFLRNQGNVAEEIDLAVKLYKPPFRYERGYIFDADNSMVADNDAQDTVGRVRGWGRIQYLPNPEILQDRVGELIAQALTEFWEKKKP